MKLTERDKILAMLLPTLIIAIAYGMFFLRGKVTESARTRSALNDARTKAMPQGRLDAQQTELNKLLQEMNANEVRLASLKEQWRGSASVCSEGANRTERVERLTALLNKHDLRLIEDVEADGAKDGKVSNVVDRLAKKMTKDAGAAKLHLRALRLYARYVDMHNALKELGHGEVLAIPVGLTMKMTDDPDLREWTLLIWI